MSNTVKIGDREVSINWDQATARRLPTRLAKHGISLNIESLKDSNTSIAAFMDWLFVLLPPEEYERHKSPDYMVGEICLKSQAERIVGAVSAVIAEVFSSEEKKTDSGNTRSQGLSLASTRKNGTATTLSNAKQSSTHGKQNKSVKK